MFPRRKKIAAKSQDLMRVAHTWARQSWGETTASGEPNSDTPGAYDISATADDYFLTRGDAPYSSQAHRACANSSNISCPHLNICSTQFGRDPEFPCDSWARGWATTWRLGLLFWVAGGALGKSMTNYERWPDYVALKPTWKGNVGWLLLIAMIVSASHFCFRYKMRSKTTRAMRRGA